MRLLKIIDGCFKLESFSKDKIPPYAILSHTWGGKDDEVTYKDIIDRTGSNKPGFQKLMFCVNQAKADGLDHFWWILVASTKRAVQNSPRLSIPCLAGTSGLRFVMHT
jgi:hypothetical protein